MKRNLEIKTILNNNKDLFVKYKFEEIKKYSSETTITSIKNLTFDSKQFKTLENLKLGDSIQIFIAISDKKTKKIITHKFFTISNIKELDKIQFSINNINNKEPLNHYYYYISLILPNKKNKKELNYFRKVFFNHVKLFDKNSRINKLKLLKLPSIAIALTFLFTILQVITTRILINEYNFVDSIINNIMVSNSILFFIYSIILDKYMFFILIYLTLLSYLFIPPSTIFLVDSTQHIYKKIKLIFTCPLKVTNEHFNINSSFKNSVYSFYLFIKEILNIKILFIFLNIIVLILILMMAIVSKDNLIHHYLNYKIQVVENYTKASLFPSIAEIYSKDNNWKREKIIIVGYDSTLTYYYEYDFIKNYLKTKHNFRKSNNIKKENAQKLDFYEVFSLYLNNIPKTNLHYIKNKDYSVLKKIEENFYLLNKNNKKDN